MKLTRWMYAFSDCASLMLDQTCVWLSVQISSNTSSLVFEWSPCVWDLPWIVNSQAQGGQEDSHQLDRTKLFTNWDNDKTSFLPCSRWLDCFLLQIWFWTSEEKSTFIKWKVCHCWAYALNCWCKFPLWAPIYASPFERSMKSYLIHSIGTCPELEKKLPTLTGEKDMPGGKTLV